MPGLGYKQPRTTQTCSLQIDIGVEDAETDIFLGNMLYLHFLLNLQATPDISNFDISKYRLMSKDIIRIHSLLFVFFSTPLISNY